jgi:4-aminobutyrate aminotransferase-like enzyme
VTIVLLSPDSAKAAVLDVLRDESLLANALAVGNHMKAGFDMLAKRHARLGAVRGQGLFIGIDILDDAGDPDPGTAGYLVNEMRRRRVLISASGPLGNVLKIRPPLPFSVADAEELINSCDTVMSQLSARR